MKKYILSLIAIGIMAWGCEDLDVLQEEPKYDAVETFMTNAERTESVILSCYYQLRRDQLFGRYEQMINETQADYNYGSGSYAYMSSYTGLDQTNISRINDTWAILYRVVRFANEILELMQDANMSEQSYKELSGELKFLRALAYLRLTWHWGGIPLFDETNWKELIRPRATVAEVYNLIVSDLTYAEQSLPDAVKQYGRPSKWAAKTCLTEVYLYLQRWVEARDKALEVINSNKYSLVPVTVADDFYNIFGPDIVGTPEEIFYIKYNSQNGAMFAWMCHTTGTSYINPTQGPMGLYSLAANKFIVDWDAADLRRPFNLYNATVSGVARKLCKKFIDPDQTGSYTSNDNPLYKYSDLLLYYAEAAARAANGPTADSMEKLNWVHRRAYGKDPKTANATVDLKLADYNTLESFINLVLKERGYETYCEGKRYIDLIRCGKLAEYVKYAKNIDITSDAAYWWPIPDNEFLHNPYFNVETDQNPGY
ncbi:MAG: RagB/SusD family nutrient uptake outer membrane protein [Dysgonamonadaceae bacterium]|nr:RagB/SusD family nutrient uptake outer membrane protein [Dysgonamonadaceae bacterium]